MSLADDLQGTKRVVLKRPREGAAGAVEQIDREERALRRIAHPNIVRIVDAGRTADDAPFLATEFHEGASLERVIATHRRLPEAWARDALVQLLGALGAVHASGAVHGDVTPANCVCVGSRSLDGPPKICLVDFGSVRWLDEPPSALTRGTPTYMAPELAGGAPTVASDLYAVGTVAYEMLVGVPPFRASTTNEILWQHQSEPVRRLRESVPSLSPTIERVVLRALAKRPEDRFASAEAFASALQEESGGPQNAIEPALSEQRRDQDARAALLARVREHWIEGVLSRATDGVILVRQALALDGAASKDAPTSIVDAFDAGSGGMLVLGDAGHGKTTNLLRLARHLADRATDASGTIGAVPVVLTMSTWTSDDADLVAWMQRELVAKYLVSSRDAARLITDGGIIPLLDGLDDVPLRARAPCAVAIDAFHRAQPKRPLVVTCRTEEYAAFSQQLDFERTLKLEPLATEDVARQLRAASQTELALAIRGNHVLDDLARTPMLLHVMRLAFRDSFTFRGALDDPHEAVRQMFEAFVASALRGVPEALRVRHERALESVARLMSRAARTLFLLEDVQPTWLSEPGDRAAYAFASRGVVATLFCASIVPAVALSPLDNEGFHVTLAFAVRLALTSALVLTAVFGAMALRSPLVTGADATRRSRPVLRSIVAGAFSGAAIGAVMFAFEHHLVASVMGVETGLVGAAILGVSRRKCESARADIVTAERIGWSFRDLDPWAIAVLAAVSIGLYASARAIDSGRSATYLALATASIGVGVLGHRARNLTTRVTPNIGIWRTGRNAAVVGAMTFAATTILFGVSYGLAYGACVGLTVATVTALWLGGVDMVHHGVVRALLHRRGALGFDAVRVLDTVVDLGLMRRAGNGYMFMHAMLLRHMAGKGRS